MDRNLKIGIVGLGLIGGSIFKALSALKCNVFGVSRSNITLQKAKEYSEHVSKSLKSLRDCDVIFVCTPMNKVNQVLDEFDEILPDSTIVTDASSLKEFVCKKQRNYRFIPSHPMAGNEFSGFDSSFESLFQGSKWILTPFENTDNNDIKTLSEIINVLGSSTVICSAKEHDEAVAMISHMPMLVSQALFSAAKDNKLAMKLASSGFRDMTRLAMSNVEMANDMIEMNSQNIQASLLKLYSSVGDLLSSDYEDKIHDIKIERSNMYVNGKNIL